VSTAEPPNARVPALVVGAGPTGLGAALALRARGRQVTLVEAEPAERQRPGSRAIYVHRETLRLLEGAQPGLGREVAARGLVWHTRRTFWRDREVFARRYPPPTSDPLPPFTSLPQAEVERCLLRACETAGVVIVWNTPITGVETTPDGVTVTTASGQRWTAAYLVAADGAHSTVRRVLGIAMEGNRSANTFVVVDVAEDPGQPMDVARTFYYEHPAVGRRNALLVPFVGGWRIDLQCFDDDDPAAFGGTEGVRRWLPRVMPASYAERITWVSTYRNEARKPPA
jgi:3-(3-hydroxy-phenyl)propionate hydroxylase